MGSKKSYGVKEFKATGDPNILLAQSKWSFKSGCCAVLCTRQPDSWPDIVFIQRLIHSKGTHSGGAACFVCACECLRCCACGCVLVNVCLRVCLCSISASVIEGSVLHRVGAHESASRQQVIHV